MKTLLIVFAAFLIPMTIMLTAFLVMDIYRRLDKRGYIDQWIDRKFGKIQNKTDRG